MTHVASSVTLEMVNLLVFKTQIFNVFLKFIFIRKENLIYCASYFRHVASKGPVLLWCIEGLYWPTLNLTPSLRFIIKILIAMMYY